MGSVIWGVFDVIREDRLDQTAKALWLLLLFVLPLFGIAAWLYAKPRLANSDNSLRLRNTL
ncbi:PLDc N-terminal domain-containing protein [Arthrobacter sp. AZCC_0090]|uniref:PLDc N-terminal domain-containing protein n=1 Tax=Arthrobacter sp. AZCC_0090 TaxID=2735881 RepID=UPI00160703BE